VGWFCFVHQKGLNACDRQGWRKVGQCRSNCRDAILKATGKRSGVFTPTRLDELSKSDLHKMVGLRRSAFTTPEYGVLPSQQEPLYDQGDRLRLEYSDILCHQPQGNSRGFRPEFLPEFLSSLLRKQGRLHRRF